MDTGSRDPPIQPSCKCMISGVRAAANGTVSGVILLDLSAAFDLVDSDILVENFPFMVLIGASLLGFKAT